MHGMQGLVAGVFIVLAMQCAVAQEEPPENHVTFYTTYGFLSEGAWNIPLKVWVHEEPDFIRRLAAKTALGQIQDRAELPALTAEMEARYVFRTHDFVADSESREKVTLSFDDDPQGRIFEIRDATGEQGTDRNGLIDGLLRLLPGEAESLLSAQGSEDGWLTFRAVSENHGGVGRVRLIAPHGVSVVSDVDDTIKITEIPAGEQAVLNNTFFREFRATPCTAAMYSGMSHDTAFHYVSGGPWQMYRPLQEFLVSSDAGFPEGSFHMKDVRTNPFESESYRDIWKLIASGSQAVTYEQKLAQISRLFTQFPGRTFILVGDSGEKDPEIFRSIRESFPAQVDEIRIRDVVNALEDDQKRLAGMTVILPESNADGSCALIRRDD